jgi:hypothetical protein
LSPTLNRRELTRHSQQQIQQRIAALNRHHRKKELWPQEELLFGFYGLR